MSGGKVGVWVGARGWVGCGWWWGRGLGVCGAKPGQLQPTWSLEQYVLEGMPNAMVSWTLYAATTNKATVFLPCCFEHFKMGTVS